VATPKHQIALIGPGELFGDEELINDHPRLNTCVCASAHGTVLVIPAKEFFRHARSLEQKERLRQSNEAKAGWRQKRQALASATASPELTSPKFKRSVWGLTSEQVAIKKNYLLDKTKNHHLHRRQHNGPMKRKVLRSFDHTLPDAATHYSKRVISPGLKTLETKVLSDRAFRSANGCRRLNLRLGSTCGSSNTSGMIFRSFDS
jgi:CRP-like cAMP-binding protein